MQDLIKTQDTKTLANDLIRITNAKSNSDIADIFKKYKIANVLEIQQLVNSIAIEQSKRILKND